MSDGAELPEGFRHEIERKYLLDRLPAFAARHPGVRIEQGYLEGGLRLRSLAGEAGCRYVLTEKRGSGLVRAEREDSIDAERFRALWPGTAGRRLRKRRWRVPEAERIWEVDEFLDRALVLAEIELEAEDESVVLPAWLAPRVVREVTLDPGYQNSALAR